MPESARERQGGFVGLELGFDSGNGTLMLAA